MPDLEKYLKRIESRVRVNIPTSLDTSGLEEEARRAATLIEQSVKVDIPVDADTRAAEIELDALGRNRTVEFKVDVDRASFAFLETALVGAGSAAANAAKLGTGGLAIGGGIEGIAALAAAAVQASGAIGVLAAALASAGGAAGVLGLAVGGQVAEMVKQQNLIEQTSKSLDTLTPGTAEYAEKLAELTDLQRAFNTTFGPAAQGLDHLKDSWAGFLEATRASTIDLIGGTLDTLANVLPKLAPAANAAAIEMGHLVDQFARFTEGDEFAAFLDWIATSGVQNLSNFVQALGNVTVGLGSILGAFTPFADGMTKGLVGLTDGFRDWAKEAAKTGAIQDFAEASVVAFQSLASLVGDLAGSLAAIGRAATTASGGLFGGIGTILDRLNQFLNSVQGQKALTGFFEGLNEGFTALGKAMGPVGKALQDVLPAVGSILGDAGKVIAGLLEALAPALAALAGPLTKVADLLAGTLVDALAGLAPSLKELASGLGDGLIQLVEGLAPLMPQLVDAFVQLADALVQAILPTLPAIVDAFLSLADAIIPLLPPLVEALLPAIAALSPLLVAMLQNVPPLVEAMTPLLKVLVDLAVPVAQIVAQLLLWTAAIVPLTGALQSGFFRVLSAVLVPILEKVADSLQIIADLLNGEFTQAFRAAEGLTAFLQPVFDFLADIIDKLETGINKAKELLDLLPGVDVNPGNLIANGHTLEFPGKGDTYNIQAHDYHDFTRQRHANRRLHAAGGIATDGN